MKCFCSSGQLYAQCCEPYHLGTRQAETPEKLMRSRFSAYCLANVPYLLATLHPSKHQLHEATHIENFAQSAHFVSLTVLNTDAQERFPSLSLAVDECGYVEFKAQFISQERLHLLHERSRFIRVDQRWWYFDGLLGADMSSKIARNDRCPCQSGQKFKHCHPHQPAGQA